MNNKNSWTDVELETKEFIMYKGNDNINSVIVPTVLTKENLSKCFQFAIEMGNMNIESEKNDVIGYDVLFCVEKSMNTTPHLEINFKQTI